MRLGEILIGGKCLLPRLSWINVGVQMAEVEQVTYSRFQAKEFFEKVAERMPVETIHVGENNHASGDYDTWNIIAYTSASTLSCNGTTIRLKANGWILEINREGGFINLIDDRRCVVVYRLMCLWRAFAYVQGGQILISLDIKLNPVDEARDC